MRRLKLSASSLKLLPYCGYYARADVDHPVDKSNPKTRAGSAVHWLNEMAVNGEAYTPEESFERHNVTPAFREIVRLSHKTWLAWWHGVGSPRFATEVAYEYDVEWQTAKQLVLTSPRDYPYRQGCVYGTADAVAALAGRPFVSDYKTGDPAFYASPRETLQMMFLGMCAAKVMGVSGALLRLQFIDPVEVKNRDNEVTGMELDTFEEWLCRAYPSIPTAAPNRGAWCSEKFCNLRPRRGVALCPAWAEETAA